MINSLARIRFDARAHGANTHKAQAPTASAQMVSLTSDRVKHIVAAANAELPYQVFYVRKHACHTRADLFGAYRLQHVIKCVCVDFERGRRRHLAAL